jgi:hypothetical protein
MSDASARGRSNRVKGATAERDLAKWLRPWYPDARRAVFNGWTSNGMSAADPGDIDGTSPDIWWSVKDCQQQQVDKWMSEMSIKAAGRIGLLVSKRRGRASPGSWWCWLRLSDLWLLTLPEDWKEAAAPPNGSAPVCMELQHVMPLLVAAGYVPSSAVAS